MLKPYFLFVLLFVLGFQSFANQKEEIGTYLCSLVNSEKTQVSIDKSLILQIVTPKNKIVLIGKSLGICSATTRSLTRLNFDFEIADDKDTDPQAADCNFLEGKITWDVSDQIGPYDLVKNRTLKLFGRSISRPDNEESPLSAAALYGNSQFVCRLLNRKLKSIH